MKKMTILALLAISLTGSAQTMPTRTVNQVDFPQVTINDAFWAPRLEKLATKTVPACITNLEQVGYLQNFINAAAGTGSHTGQFYNDAGVYEVAEGLAYSLQVSPNEEIEAKLDEWVGIIEAAQMDDGYLNTYFQLTTEERWKDMNKHEMYCAGHLLEAGIAYYKARGKRALLDVGIRMVEHMMSLFGPDKRHWVAGHQEIELALVKLYEITGEQKYLDFAYWILEERGHGHGTNGVNDDWNTTYFQDAVPVRDLKKICGHAVRAMYMFCGMADVASYRDDTGYMPALDALWHNVVDCNMYISGGIGSSSANEGFTHDYDLPNLTAYCETCASIGMVWWNHRMNLFTGEGKYVDVLERSLYNGVLSGLSLDGDKFFYDNPLESNGDHHRQTWFATACCPNNLVRFLPSMGNFIYGTSEDALWVNLYIGSKATATIGGEEVGITMTTDYPWDGTVELSFDKALTGKQVRLRIPGWCNAYTVSLGGSAITPEESDGYAVLNMNGETTITLSMEMPVEVVEADYRVLANTGRRAIQRGPLVYCAEAADNVAGFENYVVGANTSYTAAESNILGGIRTITADTEGNKLTMIPYYTWDNRAAGKMLVWLKNEDYDELNTINDIAPVLLTREYGHQFGNIAPIDMKNDGNKQLLLGAWFKFGTDQTRYSYILEKQGDEWVKVDSPFDIANRPSFSPCDINGDGNIDIVMFEGWTIDRHEGVFIGHGDGTFTELEVELVEASENLPSNFTGPLTDIHEIISADIADFDNDGDIDIVGIGRGAATVVLLNQGIKENVISLKPIYFDNGIAYDGDSNTGRNFENGMVFANDFNNDGYADIFISSDNPNSQNLGADWDRFTEVYLNNGDGTGYTRTFFAQAYPEDDSKQNPAASNGGVAIADYNGDGYLDIFIQGPGGYFWYYWDHSFVLLNDGTGHFAPIPTYDFDRLDIRNQTSVSTGASAYDWDGDGLIDIIYSGWAPSLNRAAGFIWINGNNGVEGSFRRKYHYAGGSEAPNVLADWNGDGLKDIINTGWNTSTFTDATNSERSMSVTLSAEQATEAPSAPVDVVAEVSGNVVTLSWTPATDAPASTTYELYFKNEDGVLMGNPRAYIEGEREGERKVEEFGKLGCVTTIAYTLPDGEYEWGVQAVDGRRVGSPFAKGSFTIGDSSGISNMGVAVEVLSTEYYDLQGRRLESQPATGVFIKKNVMTDGSTVVAKVVK